MTDTNHILLTRFNLPTPGAERHVRARTGWLEQRVELFKRYCLPSVQAQTCTSFDWLLYFDPDSPSWLKQWVRTIAADHRMRPIFRKSVTRQDLLSDIRTTVPTTPHRLITTNLDNDDGISSDFIERVQAAARGHHRVAIYLDQGLIVSGNRRLYLRRDRANAFCSVYEPFADAVTCWADWHNRLARTMSTVHDDGAPAWLQVVHDTNVSNRVHGTLTTPEPHIARFGGVLRALPSPTRTELLVDRLVNANSRVVIDTSRRLVKAGILLAFGKAGVDRANTLRRRIVTGSPPQPGTTRSVHSTVSVNHDGS